MSKTDKIIWKVVSGTSDNNIIFSELIVLLTKLGFENRTKGSHHIFFKSGIEEIINIQPLGNKAKPYQVKQIRAILQKYKLTEI